MTDLFTPARAGVIHLPAISLWQPWASLCFVTPRAKVNETRHWLYPARVHGQQFAMHAAKRCERLLDHPRLASLCCELFGPDWVDTLPRGGFIGKATLRGWVRADSSKPWNGADDEIDFLCGNWEPGRYGWRLEDPVPFTTPIPARGQQGWWTAELPVAA